MDVFFYFLIKICIVNSLLKTVLIDKSDIVTQTWEFSNLVSDANSKKNAGLTKTITRDVGDKNG